MKRLLAAAVSLALAVQPALSGALTRTELAPITHAEATLVVVGPSGIEVSYSPADLEALPTYSLTTRTPWRDVPAMFEGVLLTDLLAANGLEGARSISVVAENDFRTVIERATWESVDILVATRVNGRPHSRRQRGPIQFVIEENAFRTSEHTEEANLVWMAARIEPGD